MIEIVDEGENSRSSFLNVQNTLCFVRTTHENAEQIVIRNKN